MSTGAYDDSGHRSLAGFFYQAVQTVGAVIELATEFQRDDEHDGTQATTIIRPEEFGQDAVAFQAINGLTIAKVIQHKFSETPVEHPIKPQELFEIVEKLQATADRVKAKYNITPMCCLHTNRPFSRDAKKCWLAAKSGKRCNTLDTCVETVRVINGKERVFYKGRTIETNKALRASLAILAYDCKAFYNAIEILHQRAKLFGILRKELPSRLSQIEGELFAMASRNTSRQLSLADLDRWLTGDDSPRQVCAPANATAIRQEVEGLSRHIRAPNPLLPRSIASRLQSGSIDYSIIQIHGEGGVGKSALVYEHLLSLSLKPPPFVAASDSRSTLENWTGRLFAKWRNSLNDNLQRENIETTLFRLTVASPKGARPLLVLFLDGIDERDSDEVAPYLRDLATFLIAERERCIVHGHLPRVQLYLTCREENGWDSLVALDNPFGDYDSNICSIGVQEFNDEELAGISTLLFQPEGATPSSSVRSLDYAARPTPSASSLRHDRPSMHSELLQPLRHPPLLAAFRRVSSQVAKDALAGDIPSRRAVGSSYVQWFARKAVRRHQFATEDEVMWLLRCVATAASGHEAVVPFRTGWMFPLTESQVDSLVARRLFTEALSAGIVVSEANDMWRWRNEFVLFGIGATGTQSEGTST